MMSRLVCMPAELLLIVLDQLCISSIHSLSLTSRRTRELCLRPLFSTLQSQATQVVSPKLWWSLTLPVSSGNSSCIRPLNPAISPKISFIDCLYLYDSSWTWRILLPSYLLLFIHTTHLYGLVRRLRASTPLPLSKILVDAATLDYPLTFESPKLHTLILRGTRITQLSLLVTGHVNKGPGTLLFQGLEELHLTTGFNRRSKITWLSDFVERHDKLQKIHITGDVWHGNPDLPFGQRFVDAVGGEDSTRHVVLADFALTRSQPATPLDAWHVTELGVVLIISRDVTGVKAGLGVASSLVPHLSSLTLRMPRYGTYPVSINDLISPLSLFPNLRLLELGDMYGRLSFEEELPPSASNHKISHCVRAHACYRRAMALAVQSAPSIARVRISDDGYDYDEEDNSSRQWKLKALYEVHSKSFEILGTPEFLMAPRYRGSGLLV
ncbi:hypothetical protein B0H16DRAFT_1877234 [Mycena metata]|uniref:F-box domain-containing protein n=1 Tax=Mycena metata TaxID=1033252 RepID=A0AAD7KCC4_9AGAR|nr:hypothetical protein B0H16DRAFT_1877234 [Mycena metata]